MQKTILFVAYGAGHINMLIPLIKLLSLEPNFKVVTLGLTTAAPVLREHGITYFGFKDLLEPDDEKALRIGEKLVETLKGSMKIDQEESKAYLGLSFFDLITRFGQNEAEKLYSTHGRSAFLQLTIMERLFKKIKPNIVVATNSPRAEKAALLTAKKLSIPSLCLVDLFDIREIKDRLKNAGYGSRICVFSKEMKDLLIAHGRPESEIRITGNPDFDKLNDHGKRQNAKNWRKLNPGYSHVILWARSGGKPNYELNKLIDKNLIEIAIQNPNFLFIFRPHPNDSIDYTNLPKNIKVSDNNDDVQEILLASDLVLTINSTLGLQAAHVQIPVISFNMGPTFCFTPFSKMGISHGIDNIEALEQNIRHVLSQIKPKLHNDYVSSSQLVYREIKELLSDKP